MKIILLQHLSGAEIHEVGEEIEVSDQEAFRFIEKGIAEAKTKKAHNDLMVRIEKLEKEESEKQAKIVAIQKEKELKVEADALLNELVAIVATVTAMDESYSETFLDRAAKKLGKGK
ncbi:MAG: hypothetical protein ABXS91_09975 [Sulfurimonas sp.]